MLTVVVALTASLLYTIHLFGQTRDADQAADADEAFEGSLPDEATDSPEGEALYGRSCVACHGADGRGRPGAFPPLADNMPALYAREGGREYLIDVILYGLSGEIEVRGDTYDGFMAPMAHLDDDEVAEVLNYALQAWGNAYELPEDFAPIATEEVEQRRGQSLSPDAVRQQRQELGTPRVD